MSTPKQIYSLMNLVQGGPPREFYWEGQKGVNEILEGSC